MVEFSLLSPKEVMTRLHISYSTFLRLVKEGIIPSVKIGSQIRVPDTYFRFLESDSMNFNDNHAE